MKFGLQVPTFGATARFAHVLESARMAEELGYDSVWTNDHILLPKKMDPPYGTFLECVVTLAAIAQITEHVRIGTSILVLPQRNPVLVAKQIATLDQLAAGRVICGVGAGYVEEEFGFLNAPFRGRGKRLDESIDVMRHLWTHGGGTFRGADVAFTDAIFGPRPIQEGDVPIWIGGNGAGAIRRAAARGNAWHPGALDPTGFAAGVKQLVAASAGRSVQPTLKLRVRFDWVDGARNQRSPDNYSHQHDLVGSSEEMVSELRVYEEAGLEHFVAFFYHTGETELQRAIETFAAEVMPSFR